MSTTKLLIRPSFYVFWAIFCLLDEQNLIFLFLCAAVIHECGHMLAVWALGGRFERVTLSASGAEMTVQPNFYGLPHCAVALAGPAAGIFAAIVCAAFGCTMQAGANLLLSLLNLIPVLPLDGGTALWTLTELLPVRCADRTDAVLRSVSLACACIVTAAGIALLWYSGGNASVLLIGVFLLQANGRLLLKTGKYDMIKTA